MHASEPTPEAFEQLIGFIEGHAPISVSAREALRSVVRAKRVGKGEYLLRAGEVCREFIFLTEGCTRVYLITEDKEVSVWFAFAGRVGSEVQSLISGAPSSFFVEAVEPVSYLTIPKPTLDRLVAEHRELETFQRLLWEHTIVYIIDRITAFQFKSAEERYRELMANKVLLQAIPQKHIASFLGITPTSLSRLRASMGR